MSGSTTVAKLLKSQGIFEQGGKPRITGATVQEVVFGPLSRNCIEPTNKMNSVHATESNNKAEQTLYDLTREVRIALSTSSANNTEQPEQEESAEARPSF